MANYRKKKILFSIIIEDKSPISNFSLKNLPESKMDLVARCLLTIFPKYTQKIEPYFNTFFSKDKVLLEVFDLAERNLPYDELEIASMVMAKINTLAESEIQSSASEDEKITWRKEENFQAYLTSLKRKYGAIYYLHENGIPLSKTINEMKLQNSICFILGGRKDISSENESIIDNFGIKRISLGNTSYLSSTSIIFTLYELEKSSR